MSRELASTTGLYYVRNRWYDPHTGRFASEDPIGLAGGISVYTYADNSPTMLRDPTGLCSSSMVEQAPGGGPIYINCAPWPVRPGGIFTPTPGVVPNGFAGRSGGTVTDGGGQASAGPPVTTTAPRCTASDIWDRRNESWQVFNTAAGATVRGVVALAMNTGVVPDVITSSTTFPALMRETGYVGTRGFKMASVGGRWFTGRAAYVAAAGVSFSAGVAIQLAFEGGFLIGSAAVECLGI
jgi:RHS repeat-associated protein